MSNIAIFADANTGVATYKRESRLTDKMGTSSSLRRIQLSNKGTFKRIVNGEQAGGVARDSADFIIVDLLPDVSRQYYEDGYDPNVPGTLPDCWSNLGREPEPGAPRKQAASCDKCPMNVEGSGANGKGRACRFQRRLAVLVVGENTGDIYQINIPSKSLFGKGVGNVHGFESYKKFLVANGEGVDTVVTRIIYNPDAPELEVRFQPVRHLSEEEGRLVDAAQASGETEKYIQLTVAAGQGAAAPAAKPAPAASIMAEPAPTNASAAMLAGGAEEEDEDEAPFVVAPAPAAPAPAAEPVKRASKKQEAPVAAKPELAAVLGSWLSDDSGDED